MVKPPQVPCCPHEWMAEVGKPKTSREWPGMGRRWCGGCRPTQAVRKRIADGSSGRNQSFEEAKRTNGDRPILAIERAW